MGYGIHGATVGSGPNVLVVYGGYTATDAESEALALAYVSAELGAMGVGHVYAARGPRDASYAAREIGNSALAAQLANEVGPAAFVTVVAHSSGAFVADELFTEASSAVLSKIVYFDLDGGSWALDDTLVGEMKGVYFVNANDPAAGRSHNASAIDSLHSQFAASHEYTVDATGSGCNVGASWCLHDTVITTRPHNQSTFDLLDDYTDFTGAGRHVVTSYMQQAAADGVLPGAANGDDAGTEEAGDDASTDAGTDTGAEAGSDAGSDSGSGDDASPGSCYSSTLGRQVSANTCVQSKHDDQWYQCDDGNWVDRWTDPAPCNGVYPL